MRNTTLCHIEQNGCYLMLHRIKKANDLNHDKWIAVGGKFEEGESPEECNIREVFEETGLTVRNAAYRGIVTFVSEKWETEYMHIFTATDFSGKITDCSEGKLEWINKEKLMSMPIWEGDKIFLKLISNPEQPFFSLKLVYNTNDKLIYAALNGKKIEGDDF